MVPSSVQGVPTCVPIPIRPHQDNAEWGSKTGHDGIQEEAPACMNGWEAIAMPMLDSYTTTLTTLTPEFVNELTGTATRR
jgi:hypothetical protein